ncbi:hypothetical protein K438DRAFT_1980484 [Mycena galopus ATCC 62051]|nr:hypothetical protein K438DRAFT_1980484 [Mycena galopus ATCC 62051]
MAATRSLTTPSGPHILPRITEPYSGVWGVDPWAETTARMRMIESFRAAANKELCQLQMEYLNARRTGLLRTNTIGGMRIGKPSAHILLSSPSMSNTKIYQHDHPAIVKYLADAKVFKEEFGHEFSAHDADDGHDQYFNSMAFHAWLAKDLKSKCDGNPDKLAEVLSTPLTFTVFNPYNADEFRSEFNDRDFDAKCTASCSYFNFRSHSFVSKCGESSENLKETPNVLKNFPFSLPFTDVQGYYDARYMQIQLDWMVEHHRQELMDGFDDNHSGLYGSLIHQASPRRETPPFWVIPGNFRSFSARAPPARWPPPLGGAWLCFPDLPVMYQTRDRTFLGNPRQCPVIFGSRTLPPLPADGAWLCLPPLFSPLRLALASYYYTFNGMYPVTIVTSSSQTGIFSPSTFDI